MTTTRRPTPPTTTATCAATCWTRRSSWSPGGRPSAVSLRSLARRLGVSHAAPANHFPDKASLFTAIAIEGLGSWPRPSRTAPGGSAPTPPPASGSARPATPYTSFAIAHPAHFAVMWQRDLLHQDDPELAAAGDTTFELLLQGVRDAQAEGWAPAATPRPWPCWPGRWCTAWPPCGSAAPSSGPSGPSTDRRRGRRPAGRRPRRPTRPHHRLRGTACTATTAPPHPAQPRPTDTRLRVGDADGPW